MWIHCNYHSHVRWKDSNDVLLDHELSQGTYFGNHIWQLASPPCSGSIYRLMLSKSKMITESSVTRDLKDVCKSLANDLNLVLYSATADVQPVLEVLPELLLY